MADPAPLFASRAGAVPPGAEAEWFLGRDGARLRAALFPASGSVRGSVVVSPGRTEPIEKYLEVAGWLTERGFVVLVHDWRGQGLSYRALPDRTLGHARGFADFLGDYRALLDAFAARLPKPWLTLGHSMGGCLALLALSEGESRFAGAILSAPMLGLRTSPYPPRLARTLAFTLTHGGRAGAAIAQTAPKATFETNILTHERARWERNEALFRDHPELALDQPTWGWLDFAFAATARLARGGGVARVAISVVICAAAMERLVDNAAAHRIADRLPHGKYVEIPSAYHEILQETDAVQGRFWEEFDRLADALADPRGGEVAR